MLSSSILYADLCGDSKTDISKLEKRLCLPQPRTKGNVLSVSVYIYAREGHRVRARSPDKENLKPKAIAMVKTGEL